MKETCRPCNRQHVISRRLRVLPTCPEWLRLSPGLPSPAEAGLWQLTQGSWYGSHHARSLETSWWIGNKNCQILRRTHSKLCYMQGWGQLHNINSTPTPTPEVSTPTPTPTPANLQNINSNSNSNSGSFNSNSNSNSGKAPEYQLQLQLQLRRFQLQLQFQLQRFQLQFQLQLQSFKSNPNSISNPINLVQLNYHCPITMWNIVWIKWRYAVDICHVVPNLRSNRSTLA